MRCRASVVTFGPSCTGLSNGLFGSWIFPVLSSSEALPMVLTAFESMYEVEKSKPFAKRRRALKISALYSLLPRLSAGRLLDVFGLKLLDSSVDTRRGP